MRHGLQLAGITLLWSVGLNLGCNCLNHNGLWDHVTSGNFHCFSETTNSPFAQRQWWAICPPLMLCKETLKLRVWSISSSCYLPSVWVDPSLPGCHPAVPWVCWALSPVDPAVGAILSCHSVDSESPPRTVWCQTGTWEARRLPVLMTPVPLHRTTNE